MPGSSLWLLPPERHPSNTKILNLIKQVSSQFGSPHIFVPHITLTVDIPPEAYGNEAVAWLRQIKFPSAESVRVKFGALASEDAFFKKLYSGIEKSGVQEIGKVSRSVVEGFEEERKAERWAVEEFMPHLSLLYHDCPKLSNTDLASVSKLVQEAGVNLEGEGELGGWEGGRVALVPTDKAIPLWAPIAEITVE